MNKKNYFRIILGLVLAVLASGCAVNIGTAPTATVIDGGIWRSGDAGKTWSQDIAIPTTNGKIATIGNIDVRKIIFDPSDPNAIYLTTENNGIVYSYDGGSSWQQFKRLSSGMIYAVAIDPKNKCVLYSLAGNKLYKSLDCGRTWDTPYNHQNPGVVLTDLVIDFSNTSVLYVVDGAGEIIKSTNGGVSWDTIFRERNGSLFSDIIMDPANSKIIYATTLSNGIYKTIDGGVTWSSLNEGLSHYSGSLTYRKLIIDRATPGALILVSQFGILRSSDGGSTWSPLGLLPAPGTITLYSAAVNPKNSQEIYYTTATTLVKTTDGGNTWSSRALPFSRIPNTMAINPANSNIIYIGTKLPPKK